MARSQGNGSTILLGLEGYEIVEVIGEERGIVVEVGIKSQKPACPRCNSVKLYRHGRAKKRRVLHGWSQGKKVYIEIARHRWRCRGCRYSCTESVELVRPHSRLSKQAEAEALWQTKRLSFSQVKKELGISYGPIRRLLERETDEDELGFVSQEQEVFLGILRSEDDGELIRWGNTLRRWRDPILNYFDNGTTNGKLKDATQRSKCSKGSPMV